MELREALDVLAPTILVWAQMDATEEERAAWAALLAERDRLNPSGESVALAKALAAEAAYLAELAA